MNTHFTLAGPAEIIRAKQKDDNYSDTLQRLWLDILLTGSDINGVLPFYRGPFVCMTMLYFWLRGTRLWLHLRKIPIGHFLYGAATTLSGLQTLGEEYTGIIQVNSSRTNIPTYMSRLIMLALDSFGSVILTHVLSILEKKIRQSSRLEAEAQNDILESIRIFKSLLPFIDRIHKAYFYCAGTHYEISKRITGIHYVLVRRWLKDQQSLFGFKLLGIITCVHLIGMALKRLRTPLSADCKRAVKPVAAQTDGRKCPLCLEVRTNVSATPCGHLFCWTCILEWLQTQNQCPICREAVNPSRVVPLKNYS